MFTFSFWEVKALFRGYQIVFRRANSLRGRYELMKSVHFVPILSLMKFRAGTILEVTKPPASTHPFQITRWRGYKAVDKSSVSRLSPCYHCTSLQKHKRPQTQWNILWPSILFHGMYVVCCVLGFVPTSGHP